MKHEIKNSKQENNCLRESSNTRTLLAREGSEQPRTASIPHIVVYVLYDNETKDRIWNKLRRKCVCSCNTNNGFGTNSV